MTEHRFTGWACSTCAEPVRAEGLRPAFVLDPATGEPALRLDTEDGHALVVQLGWENLEILLDQAVAMANDAARRGLR